jgi:hypothetical protein
MKDVITKISAVMDRIPDEHPDREEFVMVLSMAQTILETGDIEDDDPDAEYKRQIVQDACSIIKAMEPKQAKQPPVQSPQFDTTYPPSVQHVVHTIVHQNPAYPSSDLTSFLFWIIVPAVATFVLIMAAAMI